MLKGLEPRGMATGKGSTAFNLRQNGYFPYKKKNQNACYLYEKKSSKHCFLNKKKIQNGKSFSYFLNEKKRGVKTGSESRILISYMKRKYHSHQSRECVTERSVALFFAKGHFGAPGFSILSGSSVHRNRPWDGLKSILFDLGCTFQRSIHPNFKKLDFRV